MIFSLKQYDVSISINIITSETRKSQKFSHRSWQWTAQLFLSPALPLPSPEPLHCLFLSFSHPSPFPTAKSGNGDQSRSNRLTSMLYFWAVMIMVSVLCVRLSVLVDGVWSIVLITWYSAAAGLGHTALVSVPASSLVIIPVLDFALQVRAPMKGTAPRVMTFRSYL